MSVGFYYEHLFSKYNHVVGSNRYSFDFPNYWRETVYNNRVVQLRKLLITPSARDFTVTNLFLKNGDDLLNISFRVSLAPNEGMEVFNDRLLQTIPLMIQEYRDDHDTSKFGVRDFEICYNFSKRQLIFNILSRYDGESNANYFHFDNTESSSDLDAITGVNCTELFATIRSFQEGTITLEEFQQALKKMPSVDVLMPENAETSIQRIVFNNVWSRSTLFVTSSLSESNELHYLGLSNEVYSPPKVYNVLSASSRILLREHKRKVEAAQARY